MGNLCCAERPVEIEIRTGIIARTEKNPQEDLKPKPIPIDFLNASSIASEATLASYTNILSATQRDRDSTSGKLFFKRFLRHIENEAHNYQLGKKLGGGQFGTVYQCINSKTNQTYAMKIIPKEILDHIVLQQLAKQEMYVLSQVTHPNIIRIYELLEDNINYYIVSELMPGGDLHSHLRKINFRDSYKYTANIMKQLLFALNHIHERGIAHRDLKPENILMMDENTIKLADFGFAQYLNGKKETQVQVLGSPLYMAPEITQRKEYSSAVDIWAFGCIACILLTGKHPFQGQTRDQDTIKRNIRQGKFQLSLNDMPQQAIDMIAACLSHNPDQRPSTRLLLKSEFFEKALSLELRPSVNTQVNVYNELLAYTKQSLFQTAMVSFIATEIVTNLEIEKLKQAFLKLDTTCDGYLTIQELNEGLCIVMGDLKTSSKNIKSMIDAMDSNRDGKVDYQEFIQAAIQKDVVLQKDHLMASFKLLDLNGDNKISKQELKEMFQGTLNNQSEKETLRILNQMMEEVDKNEDGFISYEEFNQSMLKLVSNHKITLK